MRHPLAVLALLASSALAAHGAPRFRLTALSPPLGYDASYATCLNDRGQVAGDLVSQRHQSVGRKRGSSAFLWTQGRLRLLPSGGAVDAVASGINNRGQVVGTLSCFFDGAWMGVDLQAVLWDGGRLQKIPRLGRGQDTMNQNTAIAINDAGQVAGTADDDFNAGAPYPHVYLYSRGNSTDLGAGCATGINDNGQIAGYVLLNANEQPTADNNNTDLIRQVQAFLCDGHGGRVILGSGYALNVNGSGNIVGTDESAVAGSGTPQSRADLTAALAASTIIVGKVFVHDHRGTEIIGPRRTNAARLAKTVLWRTGQGRSRAVLLPIRWLPQAINTGGEMVGGHWLWAGGHEYDLNHLLGPRRGWKVVSATAINQRGQITGWGRHGSRNEAFLLTPL